MAKQLEQFSDRNAVQNFESTDDLSRSLVTLLKSVKNIAFEGSGMTINCTQ